LYVRLKILTGDTLSLFINHWPSKYGGAGYTNDMRESVAQTLASGIIEIMEINPLEKIIVMGDFNDPPESSAFDVLVNNQDPTASPLLVNLSADFKGPIPGSYKFEGIWQLIDQILISNSLLTGEGNVCANSGSFKVFTPSFLLEKDEKFGGFKPFRTYTGFVYHGGYSDHLPVLLDLYSVH
jgi:endonuclease/exonuclease/phosphatase family metal-dependent hydrolase